MNNDKSSPSIFESILAFGHFFVLPALVVLRYRFGERFHPTWKWVLYSSILITFGVWLANSNSLDRYYLFNIYLSENAPSSARIIDEPAANVTLWVLIYTPILFGAIAQIQIYLRRKKAVEWHSYSAGISRFNIKNTAFVQCWIEPLTLLISGALVIGLALMNMQEANNEYFNPITGGIAFENQRIQFLNGRIFSYLGGYLFLSGVLLLVIENVRALKSRHSYLDAVDTKIENEHLQAVLFDKKRPEETKGFSVLGLPKKEFSNDEKVSLETMYRRLDPRLRSLMYEPTREPSLTKPLEPSLVLERELNREASLSLSHKANSSEIELSAPQ